MSSWACRAWSISLSTAGVRPLLATLTTGLRWWACARRARRSAGVSSVMVLAKLDDVQLIEKGRNCTAMKRTKTSKSWMTEHVNDPFVQRAKTEGLPCPGGTSSWRSTTRTN